MLVSFAAMATPANVVVLATLHGFHESVPAYGFARLKQIIEQIHPDILCLEVQAQDLQERAPEKVKVEYPRVIYPLIGQHHYRTCTLEPAEPEFSAIVKPYAASARAFRAGHPQQAKAFDAYAESGLDALRTYWSSPERVNDGITDAVFAAKHRLQEAMIGAGENAGWEGWNRHFQKVIVDTARENPGQRIVVLVGVEHTYWLRRHLKQQPGIRLENTAALVGAMHK
ncbi:MAG: DUF5694 domain-containing protein [Rhodanobacteraceae bacterium]